MKVVCLLVWVLPRGVISKPKLALGALGRTGRILCLALRTHMHTMLSLLLGGRVQSSGGRAVGSTTHHLREALDLGRGGVHSEG